LAAEIARAHLLLSKIPGGPDTGTDNLRQDLQKRLTKIAEKFENKALSFATSVEAQNEFKHAFEKGKPDRLPLLLSAMDLLNAGKDAARGVLPEDRAVGRKRASEPSIYETLKETIK
jgi:hypothetical protein